MAQTKTSLWGSCPIKLPFWLRWLPVLEYQNLLPSPEPRTTWNSPLWHRGLNMHPSVWSPNSSPKISDQRSFWNLWSFPEWLIYSLMNLNDSFAQLGLWVSILSGQLNVHKMTHMRSYLCISTLLLKCLPRIFVDGLLRPFAWRMKILPSLIYRKSWPMTSGESPHQPLSTGILPWKNYADWLDGNRPTYSYAIIFETWRPIRNSRTSLWWPHGRLSCNLVS